MSFPKSTVTLFLLFVSFCVTFFPPQTISAQSGRTPNPPTFPRCEDKIATRGDRKHEDSGSHGVPGEEDVNGRLDTYSLSDGNFVSCICDTNTGTQIDWWYINGLPLGRVDIDAYIRDGWRQENGRDWSLFDGQYLAKASEFSCSVRTQNTAVPTRTPTPTRRVTGTPTPRASVTEISDDAENDNDNEETEELPDTGIPSVATVGLSSLAIAGWYLRKKYSLR